MSDPWCVSDDADYICFTDNRELLHSSGSVWQYREAGYHGTDSANTSRYYKIMPHQLFPEYQYSLWIDGNVIIAEDGLYCRLDEMIDSGVKAAGLQHPHRDDVYDEAYRILHGRREKLPAVMKTVSFLHRSGMPRHFGLYENNVIFRKHSDPDVVRFDEMWWEILNRFSGRDQLSQTYCLWKTGLPYGLILPEGFNSRNHHFFKYVKHDSEYIKDKSLRGRAKDFSTAFNKAVYRIWSYFANRTDNGR